MYPSACASHPITSTHAHLVPAVPCPALEPSKSHAVWNVNALQTTSERSREEHSHCLEGSTVWQCAVPADRFVLHGHSWLSQ